MTREERHMIIDQLTDEELETLSQAIDTIDATSNQTMEEKVSNKSYNNSNNLASREGNLIVHDP